MRILIISLSFLFGVTITTAQQKIYVDQNATGSNDGSSWANAYTSLYQMSQNFSQSGPAISDTIMVKAGVYKENLTLGISAHRLYIFGGFNGTETYAYERNPVQNPTIVSGDILGNDDPNSAATWTDNLPILTEFVTVDLGELHMDGFEFKGAFNTTNGSAMLLSTDEGGAFTPNPTPGRGSFYIRNCTFSRNYSQGIGGAVYMKPKTNMNQSTGAFCSVTFDKCKFFENVAQTRASAIGAFGDNAYANANFYLSITNCLFYQNVDLASNNKSVIYTAASNSTALYETRLINNTFVNNDGMAGFAWTNATAANSMKLILGNNLIVGVNGNKSASVGVGGDSNTDAYNYVVKNNWGSDFTPAVLPTNYTNQNNNTSFTVANELPNLSTLDFSLGINATAIDAGSTLGFEAYLDNVDLAGNPRISGNSIDIGAFEFQNNTNGIDANELLFIQLFPNPTEHSTMVKLNEPSALKLFDISGTLIYESAESTMHLIDLSSFSAGVYILADRFGRSTRVIKK